MRGLLGLLLAVSLSGWAYGATISLDDIMNSKVDRITIKPVVYKGERVSASQTSYAPITICKLAGYSIVLSREIEHVPSAEYVYFTSTGEGVIIKYDKYDQVFKSIDCAR